MRVQISLYGTQSDTVSGRYLICSMTSRPAFRRCSAGSTGEVHESAATTQITA